MNILGITGGVGAGKSTVLSYLRDRYGALVLECDRIARELQQPGTDCYRKMADMFGPSCVTQSGELDRPAIAARVFADPKLLEELNAVVHPAVKAQVTAILKRAAEQGTSLAVIEAAVFFEDHYEQFCDKVWYVYADRKIRCERLERDRHYSPSRIADMMAAQKDDEWFRLHTDRVIDNSSDDLSVTYAQIRKGLMEDGLLYDSQRQQR